MKEKCFETTRDMLREVQLPNSRKSWVLITRASNERLKTGEGIDLKIATVIIDRQLLSQRGEAFDKNSLFPHKANVEKRIHDRFTSSTLLHSHHLYFAPNRVCNKPVNFLTSLLSGLKPKTKSDGQVLLKKKYGAHWNRTQDLQFIWRLRNTSTPPRPVTNSKPTCRVWATFSTLSSF